MTSVKNRTALKIEEAEIAERIAANLRKYMDLMDMNATELSEQTGVSNGTLSQLFSGRVVPKLVTVHRILKTIPIEFHNLVK